MVLKKRITSALRDAGYRRLVVGMLHTASLYRRHAVANPAVPFQAALVDKSTDLWFGYYDFAATVPSRTMQLCLAVWSESETASLVLSAVDGVGVHESAATCAWCWQMGCGAQWFKEDAVLFNNFDGSKFSSRVVGVDGGELASNLLLVYALSRDCHYAFYSDFAILERLSPGYGYTNVDVVDFDRCVRDSAMEREFA